MYKGGEKKGGKKIGIKGKDFIFFFKKKALKKMIEK
jgi:hypothetical protein